MPDVIIAGLIMGGLIGLPIGWLLAMGFDKWWSKLLTFIVCCAIFFSIGTMLGQVGVNNRDDFNNGMCVQCSGEYRMSGATRTRMGSETFYYTCQNCGWTIETNSLMNKY